MEKVSLVEMGSMTNYFTSLWTNFIEESILQNLLQDQEILKMRCQLKYLEEEKEKLEKKVLIESDVGWMNKNFLPISLLRYAFPYHLCQIMLVRKGEEQNARRSKRNHSKPETEFTGKGMPPI